MGNSVVFLGLLGTFPSPKNGGQLLISLTDEKRTKWPQLINTYLKAGSISHRCLEKLIGRLSFSMTCIFGEFARTQLRPLHQKFFRRVYNAQLSQHERCTLEWWRSIIADFTPRIAVSRSQIADWIIYTDAATDPPSLCALLFDGKAKSPQLRTECSSRAPVTWSYLFRTTALIYGLELLASVAYFEDFAPQLRGKSCWIYLDNNNCLAALVRGDSNTEVIAVLVARFWQLAQRYNICVWFSRVRSKLNPADHPTRGKQLPFRASVKTPFKSLRSLFQLCRTQLRRYANHTKPRFTLRRTKPNRAQLKK